MEYLDGEGTAASRAAIDAHLASCAACRAQATEHRGLARDLGAWQVEPAPRTLRPPRPSPPRPRWRLPIWALRPRAAVGAGLSTAAVILMLAVYQAKFGAPRELEGAGPHLMAVPAANFPAASGPAASTARQATGRVTKPESAADTRAADTSPAGRALIRTATLQMVAGDFGRARSNVERIVEDASGFADQISVNAAPGTARVLRASLRVPGERLNDTLAQLRALGQVTQDQQSAEDVSDQLVDLDARLKNARATEQRLSDVLRDRTGKLSDVLEVEHEVARVRLEIEQLDAQKTNMSRRVAYATIDLTIGEARRAGLEPGPLPLLTQLRVAAADGLQNVVDMLVGLMLFVLRAGPALAVWFSAVGLAWAAVKRVRAHRWSA
jgi:hypothetical protein